MRCCQKQENHERTKSKLKKWPSVVRLVKQFSTFFKLLAWEIGDLFYFEFYGKIIKKITFCGLSQKLRHKPRKVHQKMLLNLNFTYFSPVFSKNGLQAKNLSQKWVDHLNAAKDFFSSTRFQREKHCSLVKNSCWGVAQGWISELFIWIFRVSISLWGSRVRPDNLFDDRDLAGRYWEDEKQRICKHKSTFDEKPCISTLTWTYLDENWPSDGCIGQNSKWTVIFNFVR